MRDLPHRINYASNQLTDRDAVQIAECQLRQFQTPFAAGCGKRFGENPARRIWLASGHTLLRSIPEPSRHSRIVVRMSAPRVDISSRDVLLSVAVAAHA
jgi:hypothetical protein